MNEVYGTFPYGFIFNTKHTIVMVEKKKKQFQHKTAQFNLNSFKIKENPYSKWHIFEYRNYSNLIRFLVVVFFFYHCYLSFQYNFVLTFWEQHWMQPSTWFCKRGKTIPKPTYIALSKMCDARIISIVSFSNNGRCVVFCAD